VVVVMSSYKLENDEAKAWDLPNLSDAEQLEQEFENAFNIKPKWKFEPPDDKPEEILPPTAEEIEQIRKAAYDEGFEEGKQQGSEQGFAEGIEKGLAEGTEKGLSEGKAEGLEQGMQEAQGIIDSLEQVVQQLHVPLDQVNEQVKQQVSQLAATLAKAVIHTEVKTNPQVIATALEKGLEALPLNEVNIQIQLNPDDFLAIETVIPKEKREERGWVFVEKPSLGQGGCEVISKNNAVDVSIERRTRDVIDAFLLSHGLTDDNA
jgi:flagellar assembly protein FliH